jgi:hypothetical protein
MADKSTAFTIDDALSVSDGLATFGRVLEAVDEPLGIALSAYLPSLAAGRSIDPATIWDALNAAGVPNSKEDLPSVDRVAGCPKGTP